MDTTIARQDNTTFQTDNTPLNIQKLEIAAKNVEKYLSKDYAAPTLLNLMNVNQQTGPTASGLADHDYPILNGMPLALNNMTQIQVLSKLPLPPEITEHFGHVQCHCMMGLFPEINRAWLIVDSDIYVWTYEDNSDLAYYDGLNETILCVGLVKPKPGVFHNFIKYLLVLTTAVDIVVLGITFNTDAKNELSQIQLIPDPVFTIPTDGSTISTIVGTFDGRMFLGSKEGNLFEISYQAESGWFGKRCKKINHSTSALSFLVPSFLNAALSEEDGIVQISIDNSRNILYILTEKGSIEVCDLGEKGNSFSRVTKITQASLVQQAMNTVKTLDSQNFRPIVSISAIENCESLELHLIAVTQTGVRLYLSTIGLNTQQHTLRPYTLALQHVRLPPGYSANITVRPRAVHLAHYKDRNLLLLSTVNDKDVLWCVSSDLFPFSHCLMEAYTTICLDSSAIAFAEVTSHTPLKCPSHEIAPLAVRQHYEAPKKYVLLTSTGVYTFLKLRPVDLLRNLLVESQGFDSEAVKAFFMIQNEDQACATSLILASLENDTNSELAEYATRAFFVFGGEPKLNAMNQTNMFSNTTVFSPNIISTPGPHHHQPQSHTQSFVPTQNQPHNLSAYDITAPFQYSSKHNGLFLYFGRILRPIWTRKCVERVMLDNKSTVLVSTVTSEDCRWILNNLTQLNNFLQSNTLGICSTATANQPAQTSMFNNTSMNLTRTNFSLQDAQIEERISLDALKLFVNHCCQVVGLWRVLCEHSFPDLIKSLPENQQNILENTIFKDLFLYGQDICSVLITVLINTYLGDNASVDAISSKLRQICPRLYKSEDAACSKANEMLKTSQTVLNLDEKADLISSALALCKTIAPNVNLHEMCSQFTSLKAYKAVIDLCATCARKIDPDKIAEHYYKNTSNADDTSYNYYQKRMEIYKEILHMLDTVHNPPIINRSQQPTGTEENLNDLTRALVNEILETEDELLHAALYNWMIAKNMNNDLIKLKQPSLETFLTRTSQNCNIEVMDLLWKYYESNNNHTAAAKILSSLSSMTGDTINLKQRLAYLARAIMCMSSNKSGYAPCMGVYLRDLEDKLDVAKVQEQILNAITNLRGCNNPNVDEAIKALNSGLYQISQLYENFADPFQLWECELAIIDCAGYSDTVLIESIWRNILKNELKNTITCTSPNDRITQILSKVRNLARLYSSSVNCFPLEYIVQELETICVSVRANKTIIPRNLLSMNIAMDQLITIYNRLALITNNESFWKTEENEFHFAESIAALINAFLEDNNKYNNVLKRKIISLCQDTVAGLLSNIYSKPNTDELVNVLRNIQGKLSRL